MASSRRDQNEGEDITTMDSGQMRIIEARSRRTSVMTLDKNIKRQELREHRSSIQKEAPPRPRRREEAVMSDEDMLMKIIAQRSHAGDETNAGQGGVRSSSHLNVYGINPAVGMGIPIPAPNQGDLRSHIVSNSLGDDQFL